MPDSQDICPATPGLTEWNGCPDTDGDGLTTQYDNCPNEPGLRENLGCPEQAQPAPTQSPPTLQAIVLPTLPNDGTCSIATQTTTPVNIRVGTSTDTDILGQLNPQQVYGVTSVTLDDSDARWYVLEEGGNVAASVVRSTPACDVLTPLGNVQTVSRDVSEAFADCPDLLEAAAELPVFILFEAADSPGPCFTLDEALNDLLFGATLPLSLTTYETLGQMLDSCTLQTMFTLSLLNDMSDERLLTEETVNNTGCGAAINYNGLALLELGLLLGASDRERILNDDLTPAETAVRAVIIGEWGLTWEPFGQEILIYLLSVTETDSDLLSLMGDICEYIDLMVNGSNASGWFSVPIDVSPINIQRIRNGNLTEDEMRLRDALEEQCGIQWEPYGKLYLSAFIRQSHP